MPNRAELERWLLSEETGQDDAADASFAQLFTSLPRIEPRAGFADRTVQAVWRGRAQRRRAIRLAWAAAAVVVGVAGTFAYWALPFIGPLAIRTVATVTTETVPWMLAYSRVALDGWWTLVRVGGNVAAAIATPTHAAALVVAELVGILAFFALLRLVGAQRLGDVHV